jgi:hypothetical protein
MKKYGQAEYACYLLEKYVQEELAGLTAEQKELCMKKLREQVIFCFPSARELEVGG